MKRIRHQHATLDIPCLRLEGSLFLPDQLEKAALGQTKLQTEADYRTPKGLKLKDEYSRAFQVACAQWRHFGARTERADLDPAQETLRFVEELLRDAFGYTALAPCEGVAVAERVYPVTLMAGSTVPVVVAPHNLTLDEPHARFAIAGSGSRRKSAFQLAQELLNASPAHRWALVSNGRTLRLLRDAATLTRPSYLEIDLQDLLGGSRLAEFAMVWRLLHASRAGLEQGAEEVWERWREAGQEEGTRVREGLREGVTQALLALGDGFLQHPANEALRHALHQGELSADGYFQQLLRLVYRLIFLFSVEERGLLHPADDGAAAVAARRAYAEGYAVARLRELCLRRRARNRFEDLWAGMRIVFRALAAGEPRLALPALGGLFASAQCPALDGASLDNASFLTAIRHLRWASHKGTLAPVDYRNMGPEELGSVYESLLELVPDIELPARRFGFLGLTREGSTAGNARKLSGSYYTPDALVQELIKSALDPVIEQRIADNPVDPAAALLAIRVIDPACGSGHFLLAAARRLAERLAQLRAPDGAVKPQDYRHALREVIGRCIFGVDRNPMALELARTALWLEGFEESKPLGFLDAHLRCGDALIGVNDLKVLREGIPDEAYAPLKDALAGSRHIGEFVDDKDAAKALRRRNAGERKAPFLPLAGLQLSIPEDLDDALAVLSSPDESLADVEAKRRIYEQAHADGSLTWRLLRACDIWTAAFFSVKRPVERPGREGTPTSDTVWRFLSDPASLPSHVATEVDALRTQYRFFHWPVEFPEVYRDGGFELVLGNPPWETMSPDAKEYFAKHESGISAMSPAEQGTRIAQLLDLPSVRHGWEKHSRELYAAVRFTKESGRYRLFAEGNLGKGDFNIYRQFLELALTQAAPGGAAAQIVPENFYNGANAAAIRKEIFDNFRITALFGFENTREVWFKGIDTRMKFALYAAFRGHAATEMPVAFSLNSLVALQELPQRMLMLPLNLMREFSPDALAVMEFSNQLEIDIARKMYGQYPRLAEDVDGLPVWLPIAELHMGNDNASFTSDPSGWPLYQGSMVTHHDYRAKGYVSGHGRNVLWQALPFGSTEKRICPQWRVLKENIPEKIAERVRRYRIGFCDVARADDRRSLMAALIPPNTVCGDKVPTIEFEPQAPEVMMLWLAVANSLVMDFIVRMKVALKVSMSLMATLPFPRQVIQGQASALAAALAVRLSCTGPDMVDFRRRLAALPVFDGCDLTPSEDPEERARLMAELDVVVARDLFGLDRRYVEYVLEPRDVLGPECTAETFAALRRAEERDLGEYRTRRLVLEAWDGVDSTGNPG